jgi:hypothetical protein
MYLVSGSQASTLTTGAYSEPLILVNKLRVLINNMNWDLLYPWWPMGYSIIKHSVPAGAKNY